MLQLRYVTVTLISNCSRNENFLKLPRVEFHDMYHRDYKRIEVASENEPRNMNKSNGGQI